MSALCFPSIKSLSARARRGLLVAALLGVAGFASSAQARDIEIDTAFGDVFGNFIVQDWSGAKVIVVGGARNPDALFSRIGREVPIEGNQPAPRVIYPPSFPEPVDVSLDGSSRPSVAISIGGFSRSFHHRRVEGSFHPRRMERATHGFDGRGPMKTGPRGPRFSNPQ